MRLVFSRCALAQRHHGSSNKTRVNRAMPPQRMDPELNQACRSVTGCLKPTNAEDLYLLSGIAPPAIRRDVCARVERQKQTTRETETNNQRDSLPVWSDSSRQTPKV